MKDPFGLFRPSIPVSYLQLMLEILTERELDASALFKGIPINANLVTQAEARMSAVQWTLIAQRAMQLTRDPGLGYEFGLRMRPSSHGFLGYATLSCGSLREALELALRYFEARQRHFTMRMVTQGEHIAVEVREKQRIPVLRSFFVENILIGIARGAATCAGVEMNQLQGAEIWFDWAEPPYHSAYRECLPAIRFSRPANLLRFPARLLELRPVLADPHASRQAIELCERELAQAGGAGDDIVLKVCAELVLAAKSGYPDQAQLARRLHLSSRSLARKLQTSGSSYQALLTEARQRDAETLITQSGLELQEIAVKLGYSNPANFTRAYKRWTGTTPIARRGKEKQPFKILN